MKTRITIKYRETEDSKQQQSVFYVTGLLYDGIYEWVEKNLGNPYEWDAYAYKEYVCGEIN